MGAGLNLETPEEIARIQAEADGPKEDGEQAPTSAAGEEDAQNPKKRKTRKTYAEVWKFFTRGPTQEDGSYSATCNFCGAKYLQGQQRGTSSMKNHINKACKKFPRNKPDVLQKMLIAAKTEGPKLVTWVFDQMKCRKMLAKMVIAHEYPFNCVNVPYKQPAWDVPTRWNSTYLMLELALELKQAIYRYASLDKRYSFNISDFQWEAVQALAAELKVFYGATLKLSGTKYPTLNLFFTEFCEVFLTIKKMATSPYQFIVQMGTDMLAKFDKYWTIGNSLLAIATVLDPRCKIAVVEYYMKELCPKVCDSFINNLRNCMKEMFNEYVEENADGASNQNQDRLSKSQKTGASTTNIISNTRAALKDYLKEKKNPDAPKSELDEYLGSDLDQASVDEEFDILTWWKMKVPKYPVLSRLARDVLAVPISTVASESAFSTSGRVLSPVRNSLSDESIEALLCTQDWLRRMVNILVNLYGPVKAVAMRDDEDFIQAGTGGNAGEGAGGASNGI
ncbi:hypothetical protein LUZ63_013619 [Rhynchospora breviuscula]|uniref:BED-type domain-containing protein n=1 Tax=Rhynchospora breviuscula TaxID=2022672 RepID=A0A9Q0C982_9POAL|nr:hypothetical protein LUZ63_019118 [Rhynchospora breviuscula]KAJ1689464.1 hypothetical protein LUZ63_013619 [Rhynchospora breviuscula]